MKTIFFTCFTISLFFCTSIKTYAEVAINFSHQRGFYTESFDLEIKITGDDITTRVTIDGSEPSKTEGILANNPNFIKISGLNYSAVVRVFAYNNEESASATNTFIFKNDVFSQNNATVINQKAYPANWGYGTSLFGVVNCNTQAANYEMLVDDCIANIPDYEQKLYDGLMQIPTMAISIDKAQIFGADSGLYVFPVQQSDTCYTLPANVNGWERKASVEIFNDTENEDLAHLQINAGLKISGESSRYFDFYKHSFQLNFRTQYGASKLNYPLFGDEATDSFSGLELKMMAFSSPHDTDETRRQETQLHKSSWMRKLQKQMSGTAASPESKFFHLFINGLYWGLYDVSEIPEANYMADYYGGEPEDYDVIKGGEVKAGTNVAYNYMYDLAHSIYDTVPINEFDQNITVNENRASQFYNEVSNMLDVDQFIDYSLLNLYLVNTNWPANNWWAARNAEQNGKFQFFVEAGEFALNYAGIVLTLYSSSNSGVRYKYHPIDLNQRLFDVAAYKIKFGDHIQCQCIEEDGILNQTNLVKSYKAASEEINEAAMLEFARWTDVRKYESDYEPICFDVVEKTIENYEAEKFPVLLNEMMVAYGRPEGYNIFPNYIKKVRVDGAYTYEEVFHFKAVQFSKLGGEVEEGYQLNLNNPNAVGDIYYTTDGSDPRNIDGTISATAIKFEEPVTINDKTEIIARVFAETFSYEDFATKTIDNMWSAMCPRKFYLPGQAPQEGTTVSIEANVTENINVFPNPIKNQLNISSLPTQTHNNILRVLSINGKVLIEKNITETNKTINTNTLANGNYIVTISNNNKIIFSNKIIKIE